MPVTENHEIPEAGAPTAVEARHQTTDAGSETGNHQQDEAQFPTLGISSAGTSESGEERTANSEERTDSGEKPTANKKERPVKLCLHVMGDGVFCQIAALSGRPYCYRHLRLRGQQMRMARAIAQRQPYQVVLPPLDDMQAVQAALAHVAAALSAGLLERHRAGLLLYTLQQASSNLRFLARAQAQAQSAGAPPLSTSVGDRVGPGEPQRVVQEYPGFEVEFGLPSGLDLTVPPQVAFPPLEKDPWAGQPTPQPRSMNRWTKEEIEAEELVDRRSQMSEESYNKQITKVNGKIERKVTAELRKEREAEWEAEAARRNAREEEKAQRWRSMDAAQQRAYWEGVQDAHETAERDRRQEAARARKPPAKVGGEAATAGMDRVAENEAAK